MDRKGSLHVLERFLGKCDCFLTESNFLPEAHPFLVCFHRCVTISAEFVVCWELELFDGYSNE